MNDGDTEWQEFLKEDDLLFERDDEGKLLPVTVELKSLEQKKFVDAINEEGEKYKKVVVTKKAPKAKFIPPARGKWLKILEEKKEEQDRIIFTEHFVRPSTNKPFTNEDYDKDRHAIKPKTADAIITAFVALALDIDQETAADKTKEELTEVEEATLKKKSPTTNDGE